ncbi:MAG: non-canonical purine NTP pyrophosphatase [Sphaerochaetaceae bacterium]|jgi:XTP/dITP diphosphohydrolase|nr:non-canonical purine NTP pyrophosphatase [Sphaerochaetaceae bacterium]
MHILLASNNGHKREELAALLKGVELELPSDLGIDFDCDETGTTFLENSMLKARSLFYLVGGRHAVLADDSGLLVDSLPGELGIHTARFGSPDGIQLLTAEQKNRLLIKRLEGLDRRAHFVCCLTLMVSENEIYTIQRAVNGSISTHLEGSGGFGYDPVFVIDGYNVTMATLGTEVKNRIGHRALASRAMLAVINEIEKDGGDRA